MSQLRLKLLCLVVVVLLSSGCASSLARWVVPRKRTFQRVDLVNTVDAVRAPDGRVHLLLCYENGTKRALTWTDDPSRGPLTVYPQVIDYKPRFSPHWRPEGEDTNGQPAGRVLPVVRAPRAPPLNGVVLEGHLVLMYDKGELRDAFRVSKAVEVPAALAHRCLQLVGAGLLPFALVYDVVTGPLQLLTWPVWLSAWMELGIVRK